MKPCPQCGEQAITVGQFFRKLDVRRAKCQNCGVSLRASRLLYIIFYSALAFGAWGGALGVTLEKVYDWPEWSGLYAFLAAAVVVGIPAEVFAWKNGYYIAELDKRETQQTHAEATSDSAPSTESEASDA